MRLALIRTGSLPVQNQVFHSSTQFSLTRRASFPGDKNHAKISTISMNYSHSKARTDPPQNRINGDSPERASENFGVRRNMNLTRSSSPTTPQQFLSDANIRKPSSVGILPEDLESCGGDGGGHGGATLTGGNGGERMKMDAYYEEMLKSNPTDALLLRNYGKFLHEVEKDMARAEEYYGRAILANPRDGELLSLYGMLIWETQRDEVRAKSYFDQAIHAAPNDCTVLGSHALFTWQAENEQEVNVGVTEKTAATDMIAVV